MRSTGRVSRIARLFALATAICCLATGAAFAGVENITDVAGTKYALQSNGGLSYKINLVKDSETNKAELPLRVDCAGDGSGTKVRFTVAARSGGEGVTHTILPASPVTLSDKSASTTITFSDLGSTDSVFTISIALLDKAGNLVSTSGTASITVSFSTPVPLTGISLPSEFSIRRGATGKEITATPDPENATNVSYTWSSNNTGIVAVTPKGSAAELNVVASAADNDKATVTVVARGSNNIEFTKQCVVTVLSNKDLADDMKVPAKDGTSGSDLYGVDYRFIKETIGTESDTEDSIEQKIRDGAVLGGSTSQIVYVGDIISVSPDKFEYRTASSDIIRRLALDDNDELRGRYVTGMLISADVSESHKSGKIAMVPLRAAFKFPNGNEITPPHIDAKNFMDNYRIMKYFGSGRNNVVDLSSLMSGTSYIDEPDQRTQAFPLKPLIVLVNAAAPTGRSDVVYASDNKYGAKFNKNNNILYIYDGYFDASAEDPIVLERRPQSSGGGGGGGCEALGLTAVAIFAFAALGLATGRKDR